MSEHPAGMKGAELTNYRLGKLEEAVKELKDSIASVNKWLTGALTTLILSLLMLILNLVVKR